MSATTWYIARSSGLVAYLLLSSSVVLGALMAGRARFTWPRFAVEEGMPRLHGDTDREPDG